MRITIVRNASRALIRMGRTVAYLVHVNRLPWGVIQRVVQEVLYLQRVDYSV
jgi:hypothetical protein